MKKKKKGFTLVELLVTIVIIGILSFMIVPQISKLLNKGKNMYYDALEREVSVLAKDFYASNRKELPLNINDTKILTAGIMLKNGYIDEMFRDANDLACNSSFAVIKRKSDNTFDYLACLMCDDYESENETCQELKTEAGYINKIKEKHQALTPISNSEINIIKDKIIAVTGVTRDDIEFDFNYVNVNKLSGQGEYRFTYNIATKDIYGYEGLIQVVDEIAPTIEGEIAHTIKGESINVLDSLNIMDNYYQESELTIGLAEIDPIDINTPGSYTIRVTATDPSNNTTSKDIELIVFDRIATITPDGNAWTSQTLTPQITLSNIAGLTPTSWNYRVGAITSGATTWQSSVTGVGNSMSKSLTDTGVYLIEVNVTYDNGETYTQTSKQFKIDKSTPQCGEIIGSSTTWTKNDRTVSIGCSGSISGCTSTSFSKTFNTTTKIGTITIANNVGGSNICSVNAYVDKTPPECGTITTTPANASTSNWTNGQRQVVVACSDDDSKCATETFSQAYNTNMTTNIISISDNATNTTTCSVPVYIDKIPPTCSLAVASSGVSYGTKTDTYPTDSTISYGMNKTGTATYDSTDLLALGTGTFYGYVKDNAGNSGSCSATLSSLVRRYFNKTTTKCLQNFDHFDDDYYYCGRSVTSITKKTITCNHSIASYKCKCQLATFSPVGAEYNCVTQCGRQRAGAYISFTPNYTYSTSTAIGTVNVGDCTTATGFSTCAAEASVGKKNITCTNNYTYSMGHESRSTGTCTNSSAFTCNLANYQKSYHVCTKIFNYTWSTSTTTASTCDTTSAFGCNSLTANASYVSNCAAVYGCSSNTTRVGNYCYVIN